MDEATVQEEGRHERQSEMSAEFGGDQSPGCHHGFDIPKGCETNDRYCPGQQPGSNWTVLEQSVIVLDGNSHVSHRDLPLGIWGCFVRILVPLHALYLFQSRQGESISFLVSHLLSFRDRRGRSFG